MLACFVELRACSLLCSFDVDRVGLVCCGVVRGRVLRVVARREVFAERSKDLVYEFELVSYLR